MSDYFFRLSSLYSSLLEPFDPLHPNSSLRILTPNDPLLGGRVAYAFTNQLLTRND